MLIKYGKGTKKIRFPVDLHLKQAVGALTLHTGVGTISWAMDIKNARSNQFGELTRLVVWKTLQR